MAESEEDDSDSVSKCSIKEEIRVIWRLTGVDGRPIDGDRRQGSVTPLFTVNRGG